MIDNKNIHEHGRVAVRTAFEWTCEQCGRDNFERAVIQELTPDDRQDLADYNDCDVDDIPKNGELVSYPDTVTCQHCGVTFETENGDADIPE